MNLNHPQTALQGRTALVTGAGRGLGRALSVALSDAGATVIAVARDSHQLRSLTAEVHTIKPIQADLARSDDIDRLQNIVRDQFQVDVLINNAAVVEPLGPAWTAASDSVAAAVQVNLLAPVALAAAAVPGMLDRGWGRIVNVSSRVAANPGGMPGGNTYAATKAAIEAHTLNLAADLDGGGAVTANAYRPGLVDTSMQEWIRSQDVARIGSRLHDRFNGYVDQGVLVSPATSAAVLISHLSSPDNGRIWDFDDLKDVS